MAWGFLLGFVVQRAAGLEPGRVAQAVPGFERRTLRRDELEGMAGKGNIVEGRPTFRFAKDLQGDLVAEVGVRGETPVPQ